MPETEMKLALLRYNMFSKERAEASYKWRPTGTRDSKWSECEDEMIKMEDDLRKDGYEFVCTGIKAAGEVKYAIYKLTVTATAG